MISATAKVALTQERMIVSSEDFIVKKKSASYPSDLSDAEFARIESLIPAPKTGGRPRTTDMRGLLNALAHLERTGCSWRALPETFPPWKTVYRISREWWKSGLLRQVSELLWGTDSLEGVFTRVERRRR